MDIQTVLELQHKAKEAMHQLQEETKERFENLDEMDGVKVVSQAPGVRTVSFSTIVANDFTLDPAFYSRQRQIEAMSSVLLAPDLTVEQFLCLLDDMIQTKKAKQTRLNPEAIVVLTNLKEEIYV